MPQFLHLQNDDDDEHMESTYSGIWHKASSIYVLAVVILSYFILTNLQTLLGFHKSPHYYYFLWSRI